MKVAPRHLASPGMMALLMILACGRTEPVPSASGGAGATGASGSAAGTTGAAGTGAAGTTNAAAGTGAAGIMGAAGAPFEPSAINAVLRGPGCGKPLPATQEPTVPATVRGYTHYTVMGTGATLTGTVPAKAGPRTFWVRVPADYNPDRAYRVVYLGQACGGLEAANTRVLELFRESSGGTEQAIYVALDIPRSVAQQCYDTPDGPSSQELEAFDVIHSVIDASYCVDNNRIYVAGNNGGGTLANMWGCYFAGAPTPARKFAPRYHVRAQAVIWGGEPPQMTACAGPVAAIWVNGTFGLSENLAALARVGRMNGCDTSYDAAASEAWATDLPSAGGAGCKKFTGCPADYPVVFCQLPISPQSGAVPQFTIPAFTRFFDELPKP